MQVTQMDGAKRDLLLTAADTLLVRTKAAVGTNEGSFLPTTAARDQALRLEEAKASIPPNDSIVRDFELADHHAAVLRNAIVVHARVVDRDVRQNEIKRKVSTSESEATIQDLQVILAALGDERNLEECLNRKRNNEQVEKDPAQLDIEDEVAAGASE